MVKEKEEEIRRDMEDVMMRRSSHHGGGRVVKEERRVDSSGDEGSCKEAVVAKVNLFSFLFHCMVPLFPLCF